MAKLMKRRKSGKFSAIVATLTVAIIFAYMAYSSKNDIPKDLENGMEVHIIDVGQGDSALVRHNGKCILIDAGPNSSEEKLKAYLDRLGINKIDYFIATHPHEDHIGGADIILKNFEVQKLLLTDLESTSYTFEALLDAIESRNVDAEVPSVGDKYVLDDIKFTVLGPVVKTDDANNMSLVIKLSFGEMDFMFTGDAEIESETDILRRLPPAILDCEFLKVAHHGSSTSSCIDFLNAVSPDIATISCEKGNSYGHPHWETLENLKELGVENILRTDKHGNIVITTDGKEFYINTDR